MSVLYNSVFTLIEGALENGNLTEPIVVALLGMAAL